MEKIQKYKVWVEYEAEIRAYSITEAENIFREQLDFNDIKINSCRIKQNNGKTN